MEEIKNFVVFEGTADFKPFYTNSNSTVLTTDITVNLGIPNQYSKDFEVFEPNKFYGRDMNLLHIVGTTEMLDRDESVFVNMPPKIAWFGQIIDFMRFTNDGCYVATYTNLEEMVDERKNLPKRKAFHILNKKTGKCTCYDFRKTGYCKHSLGVLLKMVLTFKLGDTIANDVILSLPLDITKILDA